MIEVHQGDINVVDAEPHAVRKWVATTWLKVISDDIFLVVSRYE